MKVAQLLFIELHYSILLNLELGMNSLCAYILQSKPAYMAWQIFFKKVSLEAQFQYYSTNNVYRVVVFTLLNPEKEKLPVS